MPMLRYKFEVLASTRGDIVTRTFFKDFPSEEVAENYRRTEEVIVGYRVRKSFSEAIDAEENVSKMSHLDRSENTMVKKEVVTTPLDDSEKPTDTSLQYPKGWHRKALFESPDGKIFRFGVEVEKK